MCLELGRGGQSTAVPMNQRTALESVPRRKKKWRLGRLGVGLDLPNGRRYPDPDFVSAGIALSQQLLRPSLGPA